MVDRIRRVLHSSSFVGEGSRKVWTRLRADGLRTSKERVGRRMRENGLSALHHPRRVRGNKAYDDRITPDLPDTMGGTDATETFTRAGTATIFIPVDHCTAECIGIHASERGTRHGALEPLRQGVRRHLGGYDHGVATGLALRHDHGNPFMIRDFQQELAFLGICSTAAFIAEPECNGMAERFIRTLKEQLLGLQTFDDVDQLNEALQAFRARTNSGGLVQKHCYRTPDQLRALLSTKLARAA